MSADTTDETNDARPGGAAKAGMALAVAWCADPSRVGEVLLLDDETRVFGRGEPAGDDPHPRVLLARQRPYDTKDAPPIALSGLSRVQLEIRPAGADIDSVTAGSGASGMPAGNDSVSRWAIRSASSRLTSPTTDTVARFAE